MSCPHCNCDRPTEPYRMEGTSSSIGTLDWTDEAKCEPTHHDYSAVGIKRWGADAVVLFCRNCGDVRDVKDPVPQP